jgi:hypothetical protein
MLRLKSRQRVALGETVRALANLIAAALVLSQAVTSQSPSISLIAAGTSLWFALVAFALFLIGED